MKKKTLDVAQSTRRRNPQRKVSYPTRSCEQCGGRIHQQAVSCPHCGATYCKGCGGRIEKEAVSCPHCGYHQPVPIPYAPRRERNEAVGLVLVFLFGFFAHLYSGRVDKFFLSLGVIGVGLIVFGIPGLMGAALVAGIYALVVIAQDVREYNKGIAK